MYTTVAFVAAKLPWFTIDANSEPSETTVTGWIDEASAMLRNTLKGLGILAVFEVGSDGEKIAAGWVSDAVVGRTLRAIDSTAVEVASDGQAELDRFEELLKALRADPSFYASMLGATTSPDAATSKVHSHYLDGAAEAEPIFKRGMKF